MISVIIGINKEFLFDENISPEAKGMYLFLSFKKDIFNSVSFSTSLYEELIKDDEGIFAQAIEELIEKDYIRVEKNYNDTDETRINMLNNSDVKKFMFSLN